MEMHTCQVCNKLFASSGPRICTGCMKRLDKVYEKAREYLRDHADTELNAPALAEAIGEDVRDLEILLAEGRFERDVSSSEPDDQRRRKLLEAFQKSLGTSSGSSVEDRRTTYGRDRHGR